MRKAIIYVHGKGGNYKECEKYKDNCSGYDIIGVDYEVDYPWVVDKIIEKAYTETASKYDTVSIIANSIGAYFTMNTLKKEKIEQALLISPIVDMQRLICDMMTWAGVTESELLKQKEIKTDFGETLSWDYLQYTKDNPISWNVPTEILYAGNDNLTSRSTIDAFAKEHNANLTVMENGEHWFHTDEQLEFLNIWIKKSIK